MSNDIHRKYSQPPAKRAAFLERVEHYVNMRPEWTPAAGALLVNGVLPPEGCKDIPEAGNEIRQLDDPDLPATQNQLRGAWCVFQDYLKHVKDGDLPPGDVVLSDDFLTWCHDSDQAPWNVAKLPEFLRHLYFPGSPKHPFMLSVADEVASLKIMAAATEAAAVVAALNAPPVSHADAPAPAKIVRRRINDSKQRENELDSLIEEAIQAAGTDTTGPVWRELRKMALNGTEPFTGQIRDEDSPNSGADADALYYTTDTERKDGRKIDRLTMNALGGRLRRRSERLSKAKK